MAFLHPIGLFFIITRIPISLNPYRDIGSQQIIGINYVREKVTLSYGMDFKIVKSKSRRVQTDQDGVIELKDFSKNSRILLPSYRALPYSKGIHLGTSIGHKYMVKSLIISLVSYSYENINLGSSFEKRIQVTFPFYLYRQNSKNMEHLLNKCPLFSSLCDKDASLFGKYDKNQINVIDTMENQDKDPFKNPILNRVLQLFLIFQLWETQKECNCCIFKSSSIGLDLVWAKIKLNINDSLKYQPYPNDAMNCNVEEHIGLDNWAFSLSGLCTQFPPHQPNTSSSSSQSFFLLGFLKFKLDGTSKLNLGITDMVGSSIMSKVRSSRLMLVIWASISIMQSRSQIMPLV